MQYFSHIKDKLSKKSKTKRKSSFAEMYEKQLLEFSNLELNQEESNEYITKQKEYSKNYNFQ